MTVNNVIPIPNMDKQKVQMSLISGFIFNSYNLQ